MPFTPLVFTGISSFSSDFQTVLNRAVSIASLPLKTLQNNEADILTKKTVLGSLNTAVDALGTSVAALGTVAAISFSSVFMSNELLRVGTPGDLFAAAGWVAAPGAGAADVELPGEE